MISFCQFVAEAKNGGSTLEISGEYTAKRFEVESLVVAGLVDLVGIEPTTSSMPWKRAPSCATGPFRMECSSILTHTPWLVKLRRTELANELSCAQPQEWQQFAKAVKMDILIRRTLKYEPPIPACFFGSAVMRWRVRRPSAARTSSFLLINFRIESVARRIAADITSHSGRPLTPAHREMEDRLEHQAPNRERCRISPAKLAIGAARNAQ